MRSWDCFQGWHVSVFEMSLTSFQWAKNRIKIHVFHSKGWKVRSCFFFWNLPEYLFHHQIFHMCKRVPNINTNNPLGIREGSGCDNKDDDEERRRRKKIDVKFYCYLDASRRLCSVAGALNSQEFSICISFIYSIGFPYHSNLIHFASFLSSPEIRRRSRFKNKYNIERASVLIRGKFPTRLTYT